jgi:membrane protein YqaA with SNARE-associated domain
VLDLTAYLGLLATAFVAATILPAQSEALLAALVLSERYPAAALVAVASIGNVAGSCVNWLLGRAIERFRGRRWFPMSEAAIERAQNWYRRFGRWSLLFSWVPIVGDPLTLAAGIMREKLSVFILLVALAKTLRYVAVAALAAQWT